VDGRLTHIGMQEGANKLFLKLVGNSHPKTYKRMGLERLVFE
jgi:hypothetical protein